MILQPRDIQILKFVFACRVASLKQIRQRFFAKNTKCIPYRRTLGLIRDKYLEVKSEKKRNYFEHYVFLTELGWKAISEQWSYAIDNPLFKSDSVFHDLRLNEVLFRLEKLKCFKQYATENLLQSSSDLQSDLKFRDLSKLYADGALVVSGVSNKNFVYGVELEISKKAPERYIEKLKSYYRADGIDGVLYIVSDQQIYDCLVRADKEVCKDEDSILYLAFEKDVLSENSNGFLFKNEMQNLELV